MADNNRRRTHVFVQRTRREFSEVPARVIDRSQRKAGGSMGMGGKILRAGRELSAAAAARGGGAGFFMVELFELHAGSQMPRVDSQPSLCCLTAQSRHQPAMSCKPGCTKSVMIHV